MKASVRAAVFVRDGHKCVLCGATEDLQIDHIHPQGRGGGDEPENLRVLCRTCNCRKAGTSDRLAPRREGGTGFRQHILRIADDETFKLIDERAARVGLSRNAWIVKALEWALEQPTKERIEKVRI